MATGDKKISALPLLTGADSATDDVFVIVDTSETETKGVTRAEAVVALAAVVSTANVTAAGALMDSELTNIAAVKALDQGVATTDSPTFVDITPTGGIFLGGTAAANKLDDYEKGAWTPTWLSSGTLSLSAVDGITINNCFYTKINDLVRVDGEILMTNGPALVTSGGWIVCGGLPFPMNATTDGFATLGRGIGRKSLNSNDIVDYLMARNNSPTDFRFSYFSHAGTGAGDGHYISFSMEYRTSV